MRLLRRTCSTAASLILLTGIFYVSPTYSSEKEALNTTDLACPNCNVVLLNIDLLRSDYVSPERRGKLLPNINQFFAQNSIIFSDVSASSGVTAISNTATLTARDSEFTYGLLQRTYVDVPPQMPHRHLPLYRKTPTIAEILKKSGYQTYALNHGWYAGRQMLLNRGFTSYKGSGEVGAIDNPPGRIIEMTAATIREWGDGPTKRFLLMRSEDLRGLPYRYPSDRKRIEDPRIDYKRVAGNYYDIYYQPIEDGSVSVRFPTHPKVEWMNPILLAEYQQLARSLYEQQLKFVDEELGQIFDAIKQNSHTDNTIVILYANHGDGLYDNQVPNHGVSYQSCVSVPLLIKHPKIKQSISVDHPVQLIDLVPTILEMLGLSSPNSFDGRSMSQLIIGNYNNGEDIFFGTDKESKYVRKGYYKLIVWSDRSKELYDLKLDPTETNNLVSKDPKKASELYRLLVDHEVEQLHKVLSTVEDQRNPIGRAF